MMRRNFIIVVVVAVFFSLRSSRNPTAPEYNIGRKSIVTNVKNSSLFSLSSTTAFTSTDPQQNKIIVLSGYVAEELVDNGDPHSRNAIVMSMLYDKKSVKASYHLISSLRSTGYQGHIVIFCPESINIKRGFLKSQNVTWVPLEEADCIHGLDTGTAVYTMCFEPYSEMKATWAKYPFARDWLSDRVHNCSSCTTGPVLFAGHDTIFQRDPFDRLLVDGLQVFQEWDKVNTNEWQVRDPIQSCYQEDLLVDGTPQPYLTSATTIGTPEAMIQYLDAMYQEMLVWVENRTTCLAAGDSSWIAETDDDAVLNYLVYRKNHVLPRPLYSFAYRSGAVFVAGFLAMSFFDHDRQVQRQEIVDELYMNLRGDPWLSPHLGLTDQDGYLVQFDNITRFRVISHPKKFGGYQREWSFSVVNADNT